MKKYVSPIDVMSQVADFIEKECVPKMELYTYRSTRNVYEFKKPKVHKGFIPPHVHENRGYNPNEEIENEYPFITVKLESLSIVEDFARVGVSVRLGVCGNSLVPDRNFSEESKCKYVRINDGSGMTDLWHMIDVIYHEMFKRTVLPFHFIKDSFKVSTEDKLMDNPYFHALITFETDVPAASPELEAFLELKEGGLL